VLTWGQLAAFTATSMALLVLPGPSVLFVVAQGVAYGRRAALATVAGNTAGLGVHVAAVSLGVGQVVRRSLALFTVMKLVGAAYIVVLGVRALRHRRELLARLAGSGAASPRRLARDGFVVGVSNPKTTLFFLAVLPQFVRSSGGHGHVTAQLLALGLVFMALAIVNDSLYGLAAGSVRRWLDSSPRRVAMVGGTSGLVMIGLGVRLALTGRND
jgi:threonine/homoserine/homoserine lactone efflux protein